MPLKIEVSWSKSAPHFFVLLLVCVILFCGSNWRWHPESPRLPRELRSTIRLRSFSTGSLLHRNFDGDAIGRRWLAGLQITRRPLVPWSSPARAIFSGILSFSWQTRGGPFRAPQAHRLVLLRVLHCAQLCCSSSLCAESIRSIRFISSRILGVVRSLNACEPRFAPAIGSRRVFSSAIAWAPAFFNSRRF